MFRRFKMRLAEKQDAQKVARLFRELDQDLSLKEINDLIQDKRVVVLRKKKKTLGAFSFARIGLGIFALLYIRKFVIDKKFRGQGLGGRVLKKMRIFTRRKKGEWIFFVVARVGQKFLPQK